MNRTWRRNGWTGGLPVMGVLLVWLTGGCSIERIAVNKMGNALARGGSTFASDNDPELVREALPFSLKLMESLLAENPRHQGLLLACAQGFTQYAYAFVQQDADEAEEEDFAEAERLRTRARKLYLRARDYGLRGLAIKHPGFGDALRSDPAAAVAHARRDEVPLLYWTAAAWGAAIAVSKDKPELIADQNLVAALIQRALALNPDFDSGAIHAFLITFGMAQPGTDRDPVATARKHFDRALALSEGKLAGPLVAFAEAVSVPNQNKQEFEALLHQALAIDPDAVPEARLVNLVMQRRARWLLSRTEDLFF